MKNLTIQIRSAMQTKKILLIQFCFVFIGLHAQDSIIPVGSTVTKLSSNQYQFLEGPVWYNDSVLLFVEDGMAGTGSNIYQYDPVALQFIKWPTNSTHCVGLSCDKDGNLIGASSNILMMNKAGQVINTLASLYNGKHFDNPNDLIADAKGGVYFSDPDFFVPIPPQDKTAIYYIDSTGNVTRVIDDLEEPNGLVLSPDGTKLYAVDTGDKYVYSWDVAPDGSVSGKISLAELQSGVGSYADGMAIDIHGNIYVAGDKGVQVFSPGGVALTIIVLPEQPSNCDFGGADFKTLYITAHKNLYSIDLNYPGYAVSRIASPSGINSIPNKPTFEIFPNPAKTELNIVLNSNVQKSEIEIYNSIGLLMLKTENTEKINISSMDNGVYIVKVKIDNKYYSAKFIKE